MTGKALLDHFSGLDDPRQSWKVVYPLPEILAVILCGSLAGAEDFVEIERWARRKLSFLRRLLPFERGIASHDTLNDVMNALPVALFAECFTAWVEGLRESEPDIVAIDGKTRPRAAPGGAISMCCISSRPGLRASGSCWGSRRSGKRATRSMPSPSCSNASN